LPKIPNLLKKIKRKMIQKEKLKILFNILPINEIRNIIYKRQIGVKGVDKKKLIEALLKEDWTNKEFEEVLDLCKLIKEEDKPLGFYISKVESIDLKDLKKILSKNPARFDESGHLEEDGFEFEEKENKLIGKYYRKIVRSDIAPSGEIRELSNTYIVSFEINLESKLLFISSDVIYPLVVSF